MASTYKLVRGVVGACRNWWWDRIWKLGVPERVRSFAWQVMHGRLPTHAACHRWGQGDPWCHNCYGLEETMLHALRDYPTAIFVWNHLLPQSMRVRFFVGELGEWAQANLECDQAWEHGMKWRDLWAIACHFLW